MFLKLILLSLSVKAAELPKVEIIDAINDNKHTNIIVDDTCLVSVEKKNLKDITKILKKVNDECCLDIKIKGLQ